MSATSGKKSRVDWVMQSCRRKAHRRWTFCSSSRRHHNKVKNTLHKTINRCLQQIWKANTFPKGDFNRQVQQIWHLDGSQIEPNLYKINYLIEKPKIDEAPSNLAMVGRYILLRTSLTRSRKPNLELTVRTSWLMHSQKWMMSMGYFLKARPF